MEEAVLNDIKQAQRIVVKVGTSSLAYPSGKMNLKKFDRLARVLSDLRNDGKEVILVSSGAIGIGVGALGLSERPKETRITQAVAAVGQCELMYLYDKMFSEYSNTVAQILLTRDDIAIPRRKRNTQNTMNALLEMGIIPIVNENDTVSVEEIEIGDNDTLSAIVAQLVNADLLILFSDIDGLYSGDPHRCADAKLIPIVYNVSEVRKLAGGAATKQGTGGMVTKLDAAELATESGIHMLIANSDNIEAIYDILNGTISGTLFVSKNFRENIGDD